MHGLGSLLTEGLMEMDQRKTDLTEHIVNNKEGDQGQPKSPVLVFLTTTPSPLKKSPWRIEKTSYTLISQQQLLEEPNAEKFDNL